MEARNVRPLEGGERAELERMKEQAVGRVGVRAHYILLSADGSAVPGIVEIHQTSNVTVYKWFDRFEAEGPPGLYDRARSGRPPTMDEAAQAVVEEALSSAPTRYDYNFTQWTVPWLGSHLAAEAGVAVSGETVRRTLHALDYSWTRPRWVAPDDDPQAAQRRAAIAEAVFGAGAQTVILAEDETIFKRLPPLRALGSPRGTQPRFTTPPQNDDCCLYGVVDLINGETVHAFYERAVSEHTCHFLDLLHTHYRQRPILLIWDQASFHTSRLVEQWLDEHPNFTVRLLPKAAPQHNPVEALGRHLKDRIAANLTRSLDAIQEACHTFFHDATSQGILQLVGLAA
ncbi:MAG: IS630 family transposase [Ardenticatenaceae bacterium]